MKLNKLKHKEKESENKKGEKEKGKRISEKEKSESKKEGEDGKIKEDEKEEKLRLALEQAQESYQREKEKVSGILARVRKVLGGYLRSTYEDFPSLQYVHAQYEKALANYENYRTEKNQEEKPLLEKPKLKKPKNKEEREKLKNYNHPSKSEQNSQASSKIYTGDGKGIKEEAKKSEKQKTAVKISSQDKPIEKISSLAEKYQFSNEDDFNSRAEKILKKISLGSRENWEIMKNVTVSKLKESQLSVKLIRNIEELKEDFINLLGSQAEWREDETLKRWLVRMVDNSLKKNEN